MHPLAFQTKRFHHRNLAHGRQLLARYGLTPARFDLVYALYIHRQQARLARHHESLRQADLCRCLGVTSRTVARMVASLIELNVLTRVRHARDRRAKSISLTAAGLLRVRRAVHAIVHKNPFQRLYHRADPHAPPEKDRYRSERFMVLDALYIGVITLARFLGDFSTLFFDTHVPDD